MLQSRKYVTSDVSVMMMIVKYEYIFLRKMPRKVQMDLVSDYVLILSKS